MKTGELIIGLGVLALSQSCLSSKQKEWVRRRDGDKCQAPVKHNCNGNESEKNLPIHHILGQRYCAEVGINPDFPENVIEICQNFHDTIHPDVPVARRKFHVDNTAFDQMFQERQKKLDNREIPWNPQYDRPMQVTAIRNTQQYLLAAPDDPFPKVKHKVKYLTSKK